jgi:hypothetical protein
MYLRATQKEAQTAGFTQTCCDDEHHSTQELPQHHPPHLEKQPPVHDAALACCLKLEEPHAPP